MISRQDDSTSVDLRQGESDEDPEFVSGVQMRTSDPDDFQNLTGTFLSDDTSMIVSLNFRENPSRISRGISQTEKISLSRSCCWKSFIKFPRSGYTCG